MKSVTCPYCGGQSIFRFRRDAIRFQRGANIDDKFYCSPVNDASCYSEMPGSSLRRDADLYHCSSCDHFFESSLPDNCSAAPNAAYVLVDSIKDRIENVRGTRDWKKKEYTKMAESVQRKVAEASPEELSNRIPALLNELQNSAHELELLNVQIEVLEYIVQKDAIVPAITKAPEGTQGTPSVAPTRIEEFRGE